MAQQELVVLLKLKDELTSRLKGVNGQIKGFQESTKGAAATTAGLTAKTGGLTKGLGFSAGALTAQAGAALKSKLGVAAVAAGVGLAAKSTAEWAIQTEGLIKTLGVGAKDAVAFELAAKRVNLGASDIQATFLFMGKTIGDANARLAAGEPILKTTSIGLNILGLTAEDTARLAKEPAAAFEEVARRLAAVEDPAQRAAAAQALLGPGARRFLPVLEIFNEGLVELRSESGGVAESLAALLPTARQTDDVMDVLGETIRLLTTIVGSIIGALKPILIPIFKILQAILKPFIPIIQVIGKLFGALAPVFETLGELLEIILIPALSILSPILKALEPVLFIVGEAFRFITIAVVGLIRAIVEVLSLFGLLDGIFGDMKKNLDRVLSSLTEAKDEFKETSAEVKKADVSLKAFDEDVKQTTKDTDELKDSLDKLSPPELRRAFTPGLAAIEAIQEISRRIIGFAPGAIATPAAPSDGPVGAPGGAAMSGNIGAMNINISVDKLSASYDTENLAKDVGFHLARTFPLAMARTT